MNEFKNSLLSFQDWLNDELKKLISLLPQNSIAQSHLQEAMAYSVLGSAKRVRAFIIAKSCEIYGFEREKILNLLIAIELIHAYSLIHDDMPCMDNSDERRGKPSLHKKYDEATALLTGNSLVSLAFDLILSDDFPFEGYIKVNLLKHLSHSVGYYGMMAGQMFDIMMANKKNNTVEEFIHMNKHKTGDLFAFCMSSGAILSQNSEEREHLKSLGYDIGYIFQLADDILDFDYDTLAQAFIGHIGGVEIAKQRLQIMVLQAKERMTQFSNETDLIHLLEYIGKQVM